MKKYAVIVAGGTGLRMGAPIPKQFLLLRGKPVLWYTLTAFLSAYDDLKIILVLPGKYIANGEAIINETSDPARVQVAVGGDTRFQSVKNGLKQIEKDAIVFVHDAVRCLVSTSLIKQCYAAALENGNAIPATFAIDSIRIETGHSNTVADRAKVRLIQTPQTFKAALLLEAFEQPYDPAFTDEATVVEKTGVAIHLVEGEASNIKITSPIDLLIAEKLLEERTP